ncbi:formylglycine-generating enzyme family protein [Cognatishimia sp. WU-CL00825]|uniref:formylglycine-generating enzyme family protein n=1 Tax=Cognatishimia sp. WU-CL00825 TaxID=3127658 RepID=UPI003109274B
MKDQPDIIKVCCIPKREGEAPKRSAGSAPIAATCSQTWKSRTVSISGGTSHVGTDLPVIRVDEEGPRKPVYLKPFRIDPFTVTNRWFSEFINDTDYQTDAERYGWSLVFFDFADPNIQYRRVAATPWWCQVHGANWKHPDGPKSNINARLDHPVTHVSWNDALAFAKWAKGVLPSEAEWETAARAGNPNAIYPWGDQEPTDDVPLCNIWQGTFPENNTGQDGFLGTAPVDSFPANGFGLHNMSGNVWEWCLGGEGEHPSEDAPRLLKGGSFMCHKSYCYRYRIAARTFAGASTSSSHVGFRLISS